MFVRLVVILAIIAVAVAWGARQSDSAGKPQVYVVRAGDTLWAIAAKHYPGDPRSAVYKLENANNLGGPTVQPGERLLIP
jgi:LysM repeat protein